MMCWLSCQRRCEAWIPAPASRTPRPLGLTPLPARSLHSCHQTCGRKSSLHFPGDVFATPERAGGGPAQGPLPYLDDDIPLLNVEEEPGKRRRRLTLARWGAASTREGLWAGCFEERLSLRWGRGGWTHGLGAPHRVFRLPQSG